MSSQRTFTVGLISDTHGLLRPEAFEAMRGCDYIVHAGDIGDENILKELAWLAPVTAVRGNSDYGDWSAQLPESVVLEVGKVRLFVIHASTEADIDYATAGCEVIVSGHTHIPEAAIEDGVLFVNPGSAGPWRPNTRVSVGRLLIDGKTIAPQLIQLDVI